MIRYAARILTRHNVRRSNGVIFVQTLVHCFLLAKLCWNNIIRHLLRVNPGARRQYKSADDERMQADDNMNGVRPKAEAWRPIHNRYMQNTPSTEMISGSFLHDRADKHNQLPDEFVASMESKEHKQIEDLAGIQAQHHEQQLRKELSMVTQDNDAKHGDVNSRQEAYQEDRPQYYVFDRGSTWKQKVYQLVKCMDDLLQLIRLCPLRDTERSMSMKGYTSEQNMMTVEDGYKTADDGSLYSSVSRADTKNKTADLFTKHLDGLRVHEHSQRNWEYAFWILLMVVRTATTDDDN